MDHTAVNRKVVGGVSASLFVLSVLLAYAAMRLWETYPKQNEQHIFVSGAAVAASLLSLMLAVLLLRKL